MLTIATCTQYPMLTLSRAYNTPHLQHLVFTIHNSYPVLTIDDAYSSFMHTIPRAYTISCLQYPILTTPRAYKTRAQISSCLQYTMLTIPHAHNPPCLQHTMLTIPRAHNTQCLKYIMHPIPPAYNTPCFQYPVLTYKITLVHFAHIWAWCRRWEYSHEE